jgi:uncharacterized protein YjbJ (UPF0337 family)
MKESTKNRIKGSAKEAKGKVQERFGKKSGDIEHEDRGTMDKAKGKVQRKAGEVQKVFGN